MKSLFLLIGLFPAGLCPAGQRPPPVEHWPQHVIGFSEKVTLTDIYEAGLRPYHFPSLERSFLETKHKTVIFRMRSSGDLPPIECERITLDVSDPWLLTQMTFMTGQYTLEESRKRMLPWLKYGDKTETDMDQFLAAVRADWLHYDSNGVGKILRFGFMWKDGNGLGPRFGVSFMKAWNEKTPLRLTVDIDTFHMGKGRERKKSYDIPIPPPPGYETASMATPPNYGPDSPSSWETDEDRGFKPVRMSDGSPLPDKKKSVNSVSTPMAPVFWTRSQLWKWLLAAAFAILTAVVLLFRKLRRDKK